MKLERYEKYKDSGIEWIGEIPEHWEMRKFKFCLDLKNHKKEIENENVIALENIESWTGKLLPSESKYTGEGFFFEKDDILFGKLRPYLAKVHKSKNEGIAFGDILVFTTKNKLINSAYSFYLMASKSFISIVDSSTYGTKMPRVSPEYIMGLKIPLPSKEEQIQIADFLDKKTAQIDKAITLKEQFIERLKERRQILINDAVTKGLDKTVKMKDSGIEWIGEIPEHWEVKRAKYIFEEINIRSETGEEELLSLSKYKGVILKSLLEDRAGRAESLIGYKKVYKHTLVINKMQATNGLLGVSKIEGITSPDYSIYRTISHKYNIDYYGELLKQNLYLSEFKKIAKGVMEGFIRLYTHDLFKIYMLVPSIDEQNKIINYIKEISVQFDTFIELQQKQIEKLKEYRASLINSVVTGKIFIGERNA